MTALTNIAGAALLILGSAIGAAAADAGQDGASTDDYDLGHPCRYYLVRHLPAPTHCLVEFHGVWGPGTYQDGEFVFRSREEWLKWRDREDYQRWRRHEFHGSGGAPAPSPVAAPEPAAGPVAPASSSTVLCPAKVAVKLTAGRPSEIADQGWSATEGEFAATLDPVNPPRVSGTFLTCTYRLGGQPGAFMLTRSLGSRQCTPSGDGRGADCTP